MHALDFRGTTIYSWGKHNWDCYLQCLVPYLILLDWHQFWPKDENISIEQNLRAKNLSLCGNLCASLSLLSPFIEVLVHRKKNFIIQRITWYCTQLSRMLIHVLIGFIWSFPICQLVTCFCCEDTTSEYMMLIFHELHLKQRGK